MNSQFLLMKELRAWVLCIQLSLMHCFRKPAFLVHVLYSEETS